MESVSRRVLVIGAVGIAGAAVAGCATQPASPTAGPTGAAPTTTGPVTDTTPRWPLTGKPLASPEDAKRVAVAVKVPDNKREHIHNGMFVQQGINEADIVFVENDGYSSLPSGEAGTRLMPVFHSDYAESVQAVRSMRPVNAALFSPITGILGSTGGTGWVLQYMKAFSSYFTPIDYGQAKKAFGGKLVAYGINSKFVFKIGGSSYFDKAVTCHPAKLATLAKKFTDGPQQPYFPWADEANASTANGQPATTVKVPWAKKMNWTMSYLWNEDKKLYYRNMPWGAHKTVGGEKVTTENIMVILSPIVQGRINSKTNQISTGGSHPEPIYKVINGTGKFYYAHAGKYVTGTWTKGAVNETFKFTLEDGSPLQMAPGRTFVELPAASSKVTFKG